MAKKKDNYSAADITALTQKEHVRKRPALTFGEETGDSDYPFSSMKLTAVREISDNAVGEITQEYGSKVSITIHEDASFTVLDDGRGLPVDVGTDAEGRKVSGIYKCMAIIGSGSSLNDNKKNGYGPSLNGVGASSTIALSKYAIVKSFRNNKIYSLHFYDGDPGFFEDEKNPSKETFAPIGKDWTKLKIEKDNRSKEEKKEYPTGTSVTIKLDDSLFPTNYPFSKVDFKERMKGTASLVKDSVIIVKDEQDNTEDVYKYENGIIDLLELSQSVEPISEPIYIKGNFKVSEHGEEEKPAEYELIFSWTDKFDYYSESYVNTIRTRFGGTHEYAFEKAITNTFNDKFRSIKGGLLKKDSDPIFEDYSEGLSVIINTFVEEPQFSDQSKVRLSGKQLQREMMKSIAKELEDYLDKPKNLDNIRIIADKVITASRNRVKIREQREIERQKKQIKKSNRLPDKLMDCEVTHEPISELVICEGDSAMSSIKGARDAMYQAVIPIRGKILNTEKSTKSNIWANKEIQDITLALDCGTGENCNVDNARYQMVSIAADSDPDGQNICCLLVTLFWNLFPDYIRKGRLFKITTPLFVVKIGKNIYTAMSDEERDKIIAEFGKNKKVVVKRAKGLGELTSDEMHEFGMSRDTRILTRITLEDVQQAQEMLDITMGKDPDKRKDWLKENPVDVVLE